MLNTSTVKYQSAIRSLADLQAAGFSGEQIAELTGLVSLWNGIGASPGLNVFRQGNGGGGGSRNNGSASNR
jgi:hypothetical protein